MNWKFWVKAKPREIMIPRLHVTDIALLWDEYARLPEGRDHLARTRLWLAIEGVIPDVRYGVWELLHRGARIYVRELMK